MKTLSQLLQTLPQQGVIEWIGLRPERGAAMLSVSQTQATPQSGLIGDRYQGRSGKRQVTIIQAEHLAVIASVAGLTVVTPDQLRRNIVVRGINLLALKGQVVNIGDARMEITGQCHPCSQMEQALGPGGYNAVRGHGGMTARILTEGTVSVGDTVLLELTNDA